MADKPKRASEYKSEQEVQRALQILHDDFLDYEALGPRRVAEFLQGGPDADIQADVVGFVKALLDRCRLPE
ncbi:MAG TPA: hypothetical protein VF524_10190 [Polyangia bacterium]